MDPDFAASTAPGTDVGVAGSSADGINSPAVNPVSLVWYLCRRLATLCPVLLMMANLIS